MRYLKIILSCLHLALYFRLTISLKHHLVLKDDSRTYFGVSSFGYLFGGRLEVIVQNLTLWPDPSEDKDGLSSTNTQSEFGFMLFKLDRDIGASNPFILEPGSKHQVTCILNDPKYLYKYDSMALRIDPDSSKVLVGCSEISKLPSLSTIPYDSRRGNASHGSYKHTFNKRASSDLFDAKVPAPSISDDPSKPASSGPSNNDNSFVLPEMRLKTQSNDGKCHGTQDLPLMVSTDSMDRRSYSFNFSMFVGQHQEGLYHLTFHNCRGRRGSHLETRTPTRFNLSMLIYETNYPENYLSAGVMPLPQMYFVFSVMFFLIGSIWINFIARQKESTLKIHYLMTVLVFAKACSLLFHGINYHYIAMDGQPVVTWAYLYYATRSVKGALFFITLALIGSGWSFIKHILSDKDKKMIMVIVGLQVIAHIAEIVLDESTEGEASIEFWAELCSMVDLFSCIAILYPITWSVRHLEEASRTDGKAAINLKKLELFKKFYIISTIYIYVTRIITFVFLSLLSYRYSWLAELVFEFSTLTYFIITGYYFQPMPTNPYLLLSSDNDLEDILFSVDSQEIGSTQMTNMNNKSNQDCVTLMDESKQKVTRRLIEDIV